MTAVRARLRHGGHARSTRALISAAVIAYVLFRLLDVLVMLWVAPHQDPSGVPGKDPGDTVGYWDLAHMWDGRWYEHIATQGYPHHVPRNDIGQAEQSELAFYPLYPLLTRALMIVTGGSFPVVGSLLSVAIGAAATALLVILLRRYLDPQAALCATVIVISSPPALTFQMTYTESLAMLLLVAVLLALENERWVLAGTLGLLIGFERPIGVPLALVMVALVVRRWRARRVRPIRRREYLRLGYGLFGCGVSGLLWPLTAWAITGVPNAYSATMSAWRDHQAIAPFAGWFQISRIFFRQPWAPILVVVLMVATAVLILGPWSYRLGFLLRTWCAAYAFYLFATVVPWSSTLRYLLELFPLAAVLTGATWRRRSDLVAPLTVLLVLINLVGTLWWAWNFLRFVPPYGNPV